MPIEHEQGRHASFAARTATWLPKWNKARELFGLCKGYPFPTGIKDSISEQEDGQLVDSGSSVAVSIGYGSAANNRPIEDPKATRLE